MEVAASEGEEEPDITNKSAKIKKEELDKRVSTRREKLRGDSREEENVDEGQTCVCDRELSSLRGVVPLRADLNSERRNLSKEPTALLVLVRSSLAQGEDLVQRVISSWRSRPSNA